MKKILFTGGGTAGHVTPNIALMNLLKEKYEFSYIGSNNGLEKKLIAPICPYYPITTTKLRRSFTFKNLLIPFDLIKGIRESTFVLEKIKPDAVFSKGGYVSLPVVLGAKSLNIPVYTHESDLTFGLANKFITPFCKKIFTAFPETVKGKKTVYSGAILNDKLFTTSKENALKKFSLDGKKPILCVLGGSQGSKAINKAIRNCLSELTPKFDVLHLTGKGNLDKSLDGVNGYKQIEFTTDMASVYAITSVTVTRAGANTLFELLKKGIPSLAIPLPKGNSRGDQIQNAEYFYKKGLINLLYENSLTDKSLTTAIYSTYSNRFNYERALKNAELKDGAKFIADFLVNNV